MVSNRIRTLLSDNKMSAKNLSDELTLKLEPKKLYASCDGCAWNGVRHQKCTCCSRNTRMKDNFKAMEV